MLEALAGTAANIKFSPRIFHQIFGLGLDYVGLTTSVHSASVHY